MLIVINLFIKELTPFLKNAWHPSKKSKKKYFKKIEKVTSEIRTRDLTEETPLPWVTNHLAIQQ
jgi:hypothetical protein